MAGQKEHYHATITTKLKEDLSVRGGKYTVVLGKFDGQSFKALKLQMPGMVSPMQKADGLILITPDVKKLSKGTSVNMLPIKWEFCSSKKEDIFTK